MNARFFRRRLLLTYMMVWLLLGLVFAALIHAATGAALADALIFSVPVTLVYAVACGFSVYYLCRAFPLADKPAQVIIGVFLVSAAMAGALWTALCLLWSDLWQAGIPLGAPALAMIFGWGLILYGLSAVAHYLVIEFERARHAEKRELEAALMARESELRMLRTQIDPHFLFNSLNSISALTSMDPARARTMTVQLADFFRHSLAMDANTKVTLQAEVALALRFLAIEQVRFGARLQVSQAIDDEAAACLLPPLILQPLVENAVKHGIGNLSGGGLLHIEAQRSGSLLRICVRNQIDPEMPAADPGGIGLANVRQRLAAAYAHEASVHPARGEAEFEVVLTLPASTTEIPCAS